MDPATKFAPCLLFNRYERHLPGEPEIFRQNGRFRQSNFQGRRDRGWNRVAGRWETSNKHGPEYLGTEWKTILSAIQQETAALRPQPPTSNGSITRPRDERNIWKDEDRVRGFFLELKEGFGREPQQAEPRPPGRIFHDTYTFSAHGSEFVALTYWIFYIYNWHVFFAHEGDWEHVTLFFRKASYASGDGPVCLWFAAHNEGIMLPANHGSITWVRNTHPMVYVSRWGHPSYPTVSKHSLPDYTIRWETWHQPIPPLDQQPWNLYDGAWGEVGEWVHSTGPLGPYFKRGRDQAEFSRRIACMSQS